MTHQVNELCRRAVKANNLIALQFLLQNYPYPNPIELVSMSIKRSHFHLLDYLLISYPILDCTAALECAVKQNNLTVLKRLLLNPVTSVTYATHLAYKYMFIEALIILITYKKKYLSALKEKIPTFVIENLIKTTLLKGDRTFYRLLRHLVKDTDGLLLFLAWHNMKDLFLHHMTTLGIKNHRHVSKRLVVHPDPYFASWAAYSIEG